MVPSLEFKRCDFRDSGLGVHNLFSTLKVDGTLSFDVQRHQARAQTSYMRSFLLNVEFHPQSPKSKEEGFGFNILFLCFNRKTSSIVRTPRSELELVIIFGTFTERR